jgi:hypothetical protein
MKLKITGKVSPLMASLNKTGAESDAGAAKKMSFSFKRKPIGKSKK